MCIYQYLTVTYSHWHTRETSCIVSQLSMLAKGLACRLGQANTFRLKSQLFCEPAILISANLRKNTPKLVHNMCFSLTSIMIDLYQANCGKTLDQSYSFLTLSFEIKSLHHDACAITILLKVTSFC